MNHIIDRHSIKNGNVHFKSDEGSFLLIYKPTNWTSFQLVQKVRALTGVKKVGHAGTLDPLAEGLMLIAVGKDATRKIDQFIKQDKHYVATIKLGETTASFDLETAAALCADCMTLSVEKVREVVHSFTGKIEQVPPMYSAIKKEGRRLYDLARAGVEVDVPARMIEVYDIAVHRVALPYVDIAVHCSSGTYIRSLANDIGKKLGCGAYLHHLVRTQIGDLQAIDAMTLDDLMAALAKKGSQYQSGACRQKTND